jgi:hypothetical protein
VSGQQPEAGRKPNSGDKRKPLYSIFQNVSNKATGSKHAKASKKTVANSATITHPAAPATNSATITHPAAPATTHESPQKSQLLKLLPPFLTI